MIVSVLKGVKKKGLSEKEVGRVRGIYLHEGAGETFFVSDGNGVILWVLRDGGALRADGMWSSDFSKLQKGQVVTIKGGDD